MNKLLSGRWIFTFVSALVFAFCAFSGLLNSEQIMTIIVVVVTFYFNKERK